MQRPLILDVDSKNMFDYPPACFQKIDDPSLALKLGWLKKDLVKG